MRPEQFCNRPDAMDRKQHVVTVQHSVPYLTFFFQMIVTHFSLKISREETQKEGNYVFSHFLSRRVIL